jgi:hypothetical protein
VTWYFQRTIAVGNGFEDAGPISKSTAWQAAVLVSSAGRLHNRYRDYQDALLSR